MRSLFVLAFTLLLFATLAAAQIPTAGNVFFGYTYYNADFSNISSNFNGWEASLEGRVIPFVGIVGDLSGNYGSGGVHEHNFLFGPRVSGSVGKFRPFAEVLFGAGHVSFNGAASDTSFATAVGGGLDYRLFRPVAWRFEGDYVHTSFFGTHQNNLRLSTGIVLRF